MYLRRTSARKLESSFASTFEERPTHWESFRAGVEYKLEACVAISGSVEVADVRATLKQENAEGKVIYTTLARCACASVTDVLKCINSLKKFRG